MISCIPGVASCTSNNIKFNNFHSSINKTDNLKYSSCFDKKLSLLKIPNNLNITILNLHSDYYVPPIDFNANPNSMSNSNINIYPSKIFESTFNESCWVNIN